jgi:hypothetical protein
LAVAAQTAIGLCVALRIGRNTRDWPRQSIRLRLRVCLSLLTQFLTPLRPLLWWKGAQCALFLPELRGGLTLLRCRLRYRLCLTYGRRCRGPRRRLCRLINDAWRLPLRRGGPLRG